MKAPEKKNSSVTKREHISHRIIVYCVRRRRNFFFNIFIFMKDSTNYDRIIKPIKPVGTNITPILLDICIISQCAGLGRTKNANADCVGLSMTRTCRI